MESTAAPKGNEMTKTPNQPWTEYGCAHSCRDEAEHDEGVAAQDKYRAQFRIPSKRCVGCYLGDDGPSMHDMSYGCAYYVG